MSRKLICMCNFVDEQEIVDLLKKGVDSTAQIQALTRAGTSCGRCLPVIDDLVRRMDKTKPKPQSKQLRLGF